MMMATLLFSVGTVEVQAEVLSTLTKAVNVKNAKKISKESTLGVVNSQTLEEAGMVVAKETVAVMVTPALTSVAVSTAGAMGATASTGTAIASLSGAAATSATLAYIGTGVAGAVGVTVASPAILGGVIVAGVSSAVVFASSALLEDNE